MMEMIKSESASKNIRIYILAVISLVAMVVYAVYLVYKSEQIKKIIDNGVDKIKTLSNLDLDPGSSLISIGNTVKRKTMEKIQGAQKREDGQLLVTDDMSPE